MGYRDIRYQITSYLGKKLISFLEIFVSLDVNDRAIIPVSEFNWIPEIESEFEMIRNEFKAFLEKQNRVLDITAISVEQQKVVKADQWDIIPLYLYGSALPDYLSSFPVTKQALSRIPGMTTAIFSILKPGVHIAEHRGVYKGYLRFQLGIEVPKPEILCGLKLGDEVFHWEEGKGVVFDDTYLHTAWNDAGEKRVVLYVDFIRPMNKILTTASRLLTWVVNRSDYVQNALNNVLRVSR